MPAWKNWVAAGAVWGVLGAASTASAFQSMLPDAKLTPGKIATGNRDRGGVSAAMQDRVFVRYGIPVERRRGYKMDHLIPVELGGADAIENLWPQKINARPYTARRKEVLTRKLLELVANGQMTLPQAQKEISEDWISSFIARVGFVYLEPGEKHREAD